MNRLVEENEKCISFMVALVIGVWILCSWVYLSTNLLSGKNSGQVVHTQVPLTIWYNMVSAKGWWCFAAGM